MIWNRVLRLRLGQRGGRLVHNDEPGVAGQRTADLDHLLLAHGQVARDGLGRDVHIQLGEDLGGPLIQRPVVHQTALHGQVANEQVLCHVQLGRDGQFLIHTGNTLGNAFGGGLEAHGLSVDQVIAAVPLVGAGHDLDQCRFSRAVLTAQRVYLALTDIE